MSVALRPSTEADLPRFAAWEAENPSGAGWSLQALREELAFAGGEMLTAELDGEPAGYMALRRLPDGLELMNIFVDPARRRRGLGLALMEALIAAAGDEPIFLELRESNGAARSLYEAKGFAVVGRRPRYYRDGEAALLMRREA